MHTIYWSLPLEYRVCILFAGSLHESILASNSTLHKNWSCESYVFAMKSQSKPSILKRHFSLVEQKIASKCHRFLQPLLSAPQGVKVIVRSYHLPNNDGLKLKKQLVFKCQITIALENLNTNILIKKSFLIKYNKLTVDRQIFCNFSFDQFRP